MKVGLFIPCYVDQFYPDVGIATYELLLKLGCDVRFPMKQTCCGQPMANSGYEHLGRGCDANFVTNFAEFDYIVCPSGSCVLHVKEHLHDEKNEALSLKIRMNEDENLKDIPVLIMSASRGLEQSALDAGANDFIAKPFDMGDMISRVRTYIK